MLQFIKKLYFSQFLKIFSIFNHKVRKYFLFLLLTFILFSCNTFSDVKENYNQKEKFLYSFNHFVGKKTYDKVKVLDKYFTLDCIGTVLAIYYKMGIDINLSSYTGNGVARLFNYLKDNGKLYKNKIPKIGDFIFWDNTYDKNEDGILGNDNLTHCGIVVEIEKDGTIQYIHANYVYGIVIEQMNLNYPDIYKDEDGKKINSILALGASIKKHPHKWLSGNLFRSYGSIIY